MANVQNLLCCGLAELSGLSITDDPRQFLLDLKRERPWPSAWRSAYIFTGAGPSKTEPPAYAVEFAEFIERNNLGTVFLVPRLHRNKNSGNYVSTYIWHVKPRNLGKWFRENS